MGFADKIRYAFSEPIPVHHCSYEKTRNNDMDK